MMSETEAKQLIAGLMDIGSIDVLVNHPDGDNNVDVVLSRIPGNEHHVMGMRELERMTDRVIRDAWRKLTGQAIPRAIDPVGFINDPEAALRRVK